MPEYTTLPEALTRTGSPISPAMSMPFWFCPAEKFCTTLPFVGQIHFDGLEPPLDVPTTPPVMAAPFDADTVPFVLEVEAAEDVKDDPVVVSGALIIEWFR